MDEGEETAKQLSGRSAASDEQHAPTEIDPETVDELRALERNTITEEGTVQCTMLVDYDEATPDDVLDTALAELTASGVSAPSDRLLDASTSALTAAYSGTHAFVFVELPSGDLFVDRVFVPDRPELSTPERRRYNRFVETYGDIDLLSQLESTTVAIEYGADGWQLALDGGRELASSSSPMVPQRVVDASSLLLLGVLLAGGVLTAIAAPTYPSFGAITPRSLLLTTLFILFVGAVLEAVRTGVAAFTQRSPG